MNLFAPTLHKSDFDDESHLTSVHFNNSTVGETQIFQPTTDVSKSQKLKKKFKEMKRLFEGEGERGVSPSATLKFMDASSLYYLGTSCKLLHDIVFRDRRTMDTIWKAHLTLQIESDEGEGDSIEVDRCVCSSG